VVARFLLFNCDCDVRRRNGSGNLGFLIMTLAEKLHAIQKLARKVPKRGVNQEQGWTYMRIEDVVDVATRLMTKHKLLLGPTLKSAQRTMNDKGGGSIVDVVVSWSLTDLESHEVITVDIPGAGWDYNSKASAKALTDSRKYAMILIFNLKAGDDPEERGPVARDAAKDRQQQIVDEKLASAAAGKGVDANTPQLYYQWFDESQTALISGDKDLMKQNSDVLKAMKLGGKVIAKADDLERLKGVLEERGIPFTQLRG
jgi:ERF superfamily